MKETQDTLRTKSPTKTIAPVNPAGEQAIEYAQPQKAVTDGELVETAVNVARQTPDVRRDRVEEVKKKLADGSYRVDAEAVAEKIIVEHIETDFGKNRL